jgi:large subunit ribosomal protein L10
MPTKAPDGSKQLERKGAIVDEIKQRLSDADAAVLTEYRGLTVTAIAELRAALRPAATDYKIYKNTLAKRAASDAGLTDIAELLEGPVAIAFVRRDGGDAVTAAKALRDFAKTNPSLVLKGGLFGERPMSTAEVEALADVPPRDVILARLAGGFQAPLVKAAGLFQAFTRNFAYGIKAYIDQRAEAEPPAAATAEPVADAPEPELVADAAPESEAEAAAEETAETEAAPEAAADETE